MTVRSDVAMSGLAVGIRAAVFLLGVELLAKQSAV